MTLVRSQESNADVRYLEMLLRQIYIVKLCLPSDVYAFGLQSPDAL